MSPRTKGSGPRSGEAGDVRPTTGTAAAPLLYWLLVVCGLAGITAQRLDAPGDLLPLWAGTVGGVAIGQLIASLRVRAWVLGAVAMAGAWFSPLFFFVLYASVRGPAETCLYAFLPAAACGYLSFSERGGLAAFWYPAVLWMLVILDAPAAGALDARTALPLGIALAALFVAFLRARETRRVALWQAHASERLATPMRRDVLRASPLRAASQVVWTGFVGAAALVLAAWVAPHLWQKDQAVHTSAGQSGQSAQATSSAGASGASAQAMPCCPENGAGDTKRVRLREYMPLVRGQELDRQSLLAACTACRDGKPLTSASGSTSAPPFVDLSDGASTASASGGTWASSPSTSSGTWAPATTPSPSSVTVPSEPAVASASPVTPTQALTPKPASVPHTIPSDVGAGPVAPVASAQPAIVILVPAPSAPFGGAPWRFALVLCLGGLALHVLARAIRRQLTLRHLARPFWSETLDQRISNHWQRMLIGLRDAGIRASHHEQPQALARRVGIEGMRTCATILERVRHGVRVDAADLDAMDAAAGAVYSAARAKAGMTGRAAAWLRWPLA